MKRSGKQKLGIFVGIAVVLSIVIGLMNFLQLPEPIPTESVSSQNDSSELKLQASSVDAVDLQAVDPPVEESGEVQDIPAEVEGESSVPDVRGVVRDEKENPVAGASVHAIQADSGARQHDATTSTAEDGTYVLKGLHNNNPFPYRIVASAPGYAPTSSAALALDGFSKEVNITLLKGAPLGGRITTADGKGFEGATLSLMEPSRVTAGWLNFYTDYDGVLTATSGADGHYSFPNMSPGEYWLYVSAPQYFDEEKLFAVSPGDDSVTMDFVMNYAGEESVAGTVVDEESGQPIEGARVECRDAFIQESELRSVRRTCYTSAEGKFSVGGFRNSHPSIRVSKRGYNRKDVQTHGRNRRELDMHDLKIPMRPAYVSSGSPSKVSGRVFDSATETPISEFTVAILRQDEDVYFMCDKATYCDDTRAFRSPDGAFLIPEIVSGRVTFMVSAPGYATRRIPFFIYPKAVSEEVRQSLRERGKEDTLENIVAIGLERGATATGTVYDLHTREPVPRVRVNLDYDWQSHGIGPTSLSAFTDEMGRYRLEGVPEGSQWLIASHPGYAPAVSGETQFSRGEERSGPDILLGSGGSIEGRILDDYKKQDGVMITFQPIDSLVLLKKVRGNSYESRFLGPPRVAQTDEEGRYRTDGLTPGYCYVRTQFWSSDGRRGWDRQVNEVVEVHEGKTTIFDIPVCGATIKGTILFDDSFRSDPNKQEGYYAWLREADAPPIDLSGEGDQIIRPPVRQTMNTMTGDGWGFKFTGICAGEYTVTILRYERSGSKFVDQKSVSVMVREYGVADAKVDMRKEGLAGWKNYGSKLFQSLFGGGKSSTGQSKTRD